MLIFALVGAVVVYVICYSLWIAVHSQLTLPVAIVTAIDQIIYMPQDGIWTILRGMILVVAFYVMADTLLSLNRPHARRPARTRALIRQPSHNVE